MCLWGRGGWRKCEGRGREKKGGEESREEGGGRRSEGRMEKVRGREEGRKGGEGKGRSKSITL